MKTLKEIGTHKAVKENGVINIYEKGFTGDEKYSNGEAMFTDEDSDSFLLKDVLIDTIPLENEEDLFAIFERLEENNRCNVAEANEELSYLMG